jgi:uncharacterized protein DUF6635
MGIMGAKTTRFAGDTERHESDKVPALVPLEDAKRIVDESVVRYFDSRRAMTPQFIDETFSWSGAFRLNRKAFGQDIYRAPLNVALMAPALGVRMAAKGLDGLGKDQAAQKLRGLKLHFKTDVAEELEWLIHTRLLEIPFAQRQRSTQRDVLAEHIFSHPLMSEALEKAVNSVVDAAGPRNRDELERLLSSYMETRAANAEVVNLVVCLMAGGLIAHQVTPGALSLAPSVANVVANHAAVSSFPLGATVGNAWYSAFPAAPSAALAIGSTTGVLALAAVVTAFSGVISDPVQRHLGLHERRLDHFLDTLEQNVLFDETNHMKVRDHYVGRIIDLFDAFAALYAYAR